MTNLLEVVRVILAQPGRGGVRSAGPDYPRHRSLPQRLDNI
jgi:hypothetical protein